MVFGRVVTLFSIGVTAASGQTADFEKLFDGRSLRGWEGDVGVFQVVDGAVVGGTLDAPIVRNEYLCTVDEFDDFELRLSARVKGSKNAGVHFRSQRVPDTRDVAGYQADIGFIPGEWLTRLSDVESADPDRLYPLWGSLLDEFRQGIDRYRDPDMPYHLMAVADPDVVEGILRKDDWNDISVIADGRRIEIRLNEVTTIEFIEEEDVPLSGLICLQVHSGGPSEAWYRDILIRDLPAEFHR